MLNADVKTRSAAIKQHQTAPVRNGEQDALPFFQPKLSVNQPGDQYEQEADKVADQVVQRLAENQSAPSPTEGGKNEAQPNIQRLPITPIQRSAIPASTLIQAKCASCEQEEKLQKKEEDEPEVQAKIQRKPIFDSAAEPPDEGQNNGNIQRKPIFESAGENSDAPIQRREMPAAQNWGAIQMKCADCAAEEEKKLQRTESANAAPTPTADFSSRLQSSKGGGSPLPKDVSSSMGDAMGADLSNVRVHTGSEAAGMSQSIQAQAFTHGSDVYFNEGKYDPGSTDGKRLLAHELVHTVQQGGGIERKIQRTEATDLIENNTFLFNLDEEGLGRHLANIASMQSTLVEEVLNELSSSDRDDVAYEIVISSSGRLSNIPENLRIRFVQELSGGVVTDDEEGVIANIWISFDPALPEVAGRHRELWRKSLWESDQLIAYIEPKVEAFRSDIRDLALAFLSTNNQEVIDEAARYGIDIENSMELTERTPDYIETVRAVSTNVLRLQNFLNELSQIPVGYRRHTSHDEFGVEDSYEETVYFNPNSAPPISPDGTESRPMPRWEEVKTQYDRVNAIISSFGDLYPTIYILIQQGKLDDLTNAGNSLEAQNVIIEGFEHIRGKIQESVEKIETRDIEYYDLQMIYEQLLSNSIRIPFNSSFPWEQPFFSDIARNDLRDREASQFWIDLGLSLVAAAALIAAPFTGGASAAFLVGFGVGIGIGQAGVSWERYLDMATIGEANAREELELISDGQISAQLLESIINTAAAFLDIWGARGIVGVTARASRVAAFELAEREVREQLIQEARRRAIRGAVIEGAATLGGAGLAIGLHESGEEDPVPEFEASVEARQIVLPMESSESPSDLVSRQIIQRVPVVGGVPPAVSGSTHSIPLSGPEFELYIERALKRGEIGGVPRMDYVIPGQYTGSGHGIDRIGIAIDPNTGVISFYHFEMKYVREGSTYRPRLGTPSAGTQTGASWTEHAIENFLTSQRPEARAYRERLRRAMQNIHPGEYIDISRMRSFLEDGLRTAPVRVIVPHFADLRRLIRQVSALVGHGRDARIIRAIVP